MCVIELSHVPFGKSSGSRDTIKEICIANVWS